MPLNIRPESGGRVLLVEVSGKLTRADYRVFGPKVEDLIREHGKIRVLLSMHDFHGWELGALLEDVRFDIRHFRDIERLALVGESKWQEMMATFCRPFTTAEIRYFDHSQEEQARQWLDSP